MLSDSGRVGAKLVSKVPDGSICGVTFDYVHKVTGNEATIIYSRCDVLFVNQIIKAQKIPKLLIDEMNKKLDFLLYLSRHHYTAAILHGIEE